MLECSIKFNGFNNNLDLLQVDLHEKNKREKNASASDEVASARKVDLSNLQDSICISRQNCRVNLAIN